MEEIYSEQNATGLVTRPEFIMYCRSVNGDLTDLKLAVSNVDSKLEVRHKETLDHFDAIVNAETERRRADIQAAFANTKTEVKDALKGTMSKSYAIIITILTAACSGLLGAVIALIATRGRL